MVKKQKKNLFRSTFVAAHFSRLSGGKNRAGVWRETRHRHSVLLQQQQRVDAQSGEARPVTQTVATQRKPHVNRVQKKLQNFMKRLKTFFFFFAVN